MANIKELSRSPEKLAPGHRMCGGCGATIAVRQILAALPDDVYPVVGCATGCLGRSPLLGFHTCGGRNLTTGQLRRFLLMGIALERLGHILGMDGVLRSGLFAAEPITPSTLAAPHTALSPATEHAVRHLTVVSLHAAAPVFPFGRFKVSARHTSPST